MKLATLKSYHAKEPKTKIIMILLVKERALASNGF
jgi:hypothetical protein